MGFMKSVDIVLSEYKLSDAQKNAVVNIMSGGTEKIQVRTYASLEKKGLIHTTLDGWALDESFHDKLKAAYSQPEPREIDGDFTPENVSRAIQDIESTESDEPAIPFFNRKALRDLRRNQARVNRRMMREQGKRRRKYGADDPKYFRRGYLRMLAETSDTAYDAA